MIGSSTGTNLAIGIALILRDQFSGTARMAGQELDNLQKRSQRANLEAARNVNAIGAATGVAALGAMRDWVKTGLDFEKQMTYVYAISEKQQGYSLDKMKKRAQEVGVNTMFDAQQVAEGMVYMAQAGMTLEEVYKNINAAAILAGGTMSTVNNAADVMSSVMIGFDIPASEQNALRVADIITQSLNQSKMDIDSYSESIKYIIPTARTLGISLEEVSATMSTVAQAGLRGSQAGTGTENFFRYLANAASGDSKKANEALAKLGMTVGDIKDSSGNLLPLPQIISKIGSALEGLGNVEQMNVMHDIFGTRGMRPAVLVSTLKQAAGSQGLFNKFLEQINASQGMANSINNQMMGAVPGKMDQFNESMNNLKIAFTGALIPALSVVLPILTKFFTILKSAMETPMGKWLITLAAGFVLIKTAVMGYRAVVLTLNLLHGRLGQGFAGTAGSVTSGYNMMTAAAQRYAAAANMGIAGAVGAAGRYSYSKGIGAQFMGPAIWNAKRKQWTSNNWGISKDAALSQRYMQRYGAGARFAHLSNKIGNVAPWAALGGMGLQMAAGAVGEDTGAGRVMNVAGGALGWAGTGAMLGSVIPGIGTAAGAIVGGVGGLLWGLYDDMKNEEQRLKEAKDKADALKEESGGFDPVQWKVNAQKYLSMQYGDVAYTKGYLGGQQFGTTRAGANMWLQNGGNYSHPKSNRITINIDGKQAMDKTVGDRDYETFVNLGF